VTVQGTDVLLTTQYLEEADQLARDVVIIDRSRINSRPTPGASSQDRRRGPPVPSRHPGVDLARKVGAFGLAGRANDEIAATGARPRRVLQTELDALTASERRVAQLAADGMSNKEIAQTLFVTIKTVETHLSHAYRKLEISSRARLHKALLTPAPSPSPASA